jgi:protoporphyrinogen oxidase
MRPSIVVLGAGPAGIGAGLALGERGIVLEASSSPGGICQTIEFAGAFFDLGGHSFHTPHPDIRDLVFGAVKMEEQLRQAWCCYQDELIPYPFQRNFELLSDKSVVEECQAGLKTAQQKSRARNYEEYLETRFGPGITKHFLKPYNQKLWGADLKRLSADWVRERIPGTAKAEDKVSTDDRKRTPLQSNTVVAYPARGGFGEIFKSLAARLPDVRYGDKVARIDPREHELVTSRGQRFKWDALISSLALPDLLSLFEKLPNHIDDAVSRLEALPISLVLFSIDRRLKTEIQRVYSSDFDMPAHKIVFTNNSSDYLRSLQNHGITAEVSGYRKETDEELVEKVSARLRDLQLLPHAARIRSAKVIRLGRAYPVPSLHRDASVQKIKEWLEAQNIYSVGRFGEWAYINSDEALYRGLVMGQALAQKRAA